MDWENVTGCLNLTIAEWNPYTIFLNSTPPYKVVGSIIDIVDIIAEKMGFCYNLVRGKDTDWGMELPDGSWSGSIGILHRGEASMSATVYSMSVKRTKAIDFGTPVYINDQTVAFKRPVLGHDVTGFIKPFHYNTWIGVLTMLLTACAVISVVQFIHNWIVMTSNLPPSKKKSQFDSVGFHHYQWSFGNLMGQAPEWEPKGDSVRVFGAMWLLMAFILSNYYCSNLRAILITPKVVLPFNDFWGLAKTNFLVWAPKGSRFNEALNNAEEGSKLAAVRKNIILTRNITEGPEGLYEGKWGVVDVRGAVIYYLHHDYSQKGYCQSYIIEDGVLRTTSLSFGYPKGSTMRPKVDDIVRRLQESGIIDQKFRWRVRNATECLKPIGSGFSDTQRAMALPDFYGVFAIYLGGTALSMLVFGWELCVSATCGSKKKVHILSFHRFSRSRGLQDGQDKPSDPANEDKLSAHDEQ
ncbi:glutamate receptor 4-like [Macrobrachium nipponense]|uniref:glutamate receptor 4-like n=1 Tax=Macrobrachium nipponense TaxID=159736 RepID=UPI0030C834AE